MGFSLLEIIVTLVILTMGILPLFQESLFLQKQILQNYFNHQALQHAISIRERLRANTSPEHRQNEISIWKSEVSNFFPEGKGIVYCQAIRCDISICWHLRKDQCFNIKLPI